MYIYGSCVNVYVVIWVLGFGYVIRIVIGTERRKI